MIEYVRRVKPDLKALGFRNLDTFAHRGVETPLSRQSDRLTADSTTIPGSGILQHNLSCIRIRNRVQRAEWLQRRRNRTTLRIINPQELTGSEIASELSFPFHIPLGIEGADDIRHSISIQHVGCSEARRLARAGVDDEAGLPAFDDSCNDSRTVAE